MLDNRTPRERFMAALDRQAPYGRVPHFELVYYLTMETFGRVHPLHRKYDQWLLMSENERQLHRRDMADLYIAIAERFDWDAILLMSNPWNYDEHFRLADLVREKTGDRYFLMMHGDATFPIPDGDKLAEFSFRLVDEPDKVKDKAQQLVDKLTREQEILKKHGGFDGLALCSDYCFNTGPFLSPDQFAEFIAPYLKQLIKNQRELGLYSIKHTDGNIMPILDQLVDCNPHALHSLDPQGGVDIAEIKRRCGDRLCLIGNVNCGLLDTGTDAEAAESARYALHHGMPGGGYIFSTSNCVYTGMRPERYELIWRIWKEEGLYQD